MSTTSFPQASSAKPQRVATQKPTPTYSTSAMPASKRDNSYFAQSHSTSDFSEASSSSSVAQKSANQLFGINPYLTDNSTLFSESAISSAAFSHTSAELKPQNLSQQFESDISVSDRQSQRFVPSVPGLTFEPISYSPISSGVVNSAFAKNSGTLVDERSSSDLFTPEFRAHYEAGWLGGEFGKKGPVDFNTAVEHATQKVNCRTARALKAMGLVGVRLKFAKLMFNRSLLDSRERSSDNTAEIMGILKNNPEQFTRLSSPFLKSQILQLFDELSAQCEDEQFNTNRVKDAISTLYLIDTFGPKFFGVEYIQNIFSQNCKKLDSSDFAFRLLELCGTNVIGTDNINSFFKNCLMESRYTSYSVPTVLEELIKYYGNDIQGDMISLAYTAKARMGMDEEFLKPIIDKYVIIHPHRNIILSQKDKSKTEEKDEGSLGENQAESLGENQAESLGENQAGSLGENQAGSLEANQDKFLEETDLNSLGDRSLQFSRTKTPD